MEMSSPVMTLIIRMMASYTEALISESREGRILASIFLDARLVVHVVRLHPMGVGAELGRKAWVRHLV